jgi:hypothetical protein
VESSLSKNLDLKRDVEELENRIHNITGVWITHVDNSVWKWSSLLWMGLYAHDKAFDSRTE